MQNKQGKKRICIIGVRSGSKSIHDKNIKPFCGKPLMSHTIEHAINSRLFDTICITSDSQKYLEIAKQYKECETVVRPKYLATDKAAKLPVIRHALEVMENKNETIYDTITILQVTSPLRLVSDIVAAVELFENKKDINNVISVNIAHSSPYFTMVERNKNSKIVPCKPNDKIISRRQDSPICYNINGSIYVWNRKALKKANTSITDNTEIYIMPDYRSVDIDNPLDFLFAELIAKKVDIETGSIV